MSVAVVGSLLGTAFGDALGLPNENLSPRRADRLLEAFLFDCSQSLIAELPSTQLI